MADTVAGEPQDSRTVARSAAGMGAAATVSRIFGAIRALTIATVLGTTYLGNAFQGSNSFSTVLFELLAAGALSAVLVPTFVRHFAEGRQRDAELLAGSLLGYAVVALGAISVVGIVLAPWIAGFLTAAVEDPTIAAQQKELSTFLLRFFIPQLVLYAVGTITIAILHARRSFVIPAVAPIANTLIMIGFLLAFRAMAGADPGLELSLGEQLLLAAAGTLGVAGMVAVPVIGVWRSGLRLRPRLRRTAELGRVLRLSGWATAQHASLGLLLGGAIVVGGGVEGGVIAYQVGIYFYHAPYGIVAQPIHAAITPELVAEHREGDLQAFGASVRWALDSMSVLLLPMSALGLALALPVMEVLAFGEAATTDGAQLLAAALGGLCLGLLPYGAFLMLARAAYVLGDSKTPALIALVSSVASVVLMVVGGALTEGAATVFVLGAAHSTSFLCGSIALGIWLHRQIHQPVVPPLLARSLVLSVLVGVGAWAAMAWWSTPSRLATIGALAVVGGVAVGAYALLLRMVGVSLTQRLPSRGAPT